MTSPNRFRSIAAAVLALLALGAREPAVAQTATIDIVVTESGVPVAGRDIELRDLASGRRIPLRTNAQGSARSAALPAAGEYEVWIDGERRLDQRRQRRGLCRADGSRDRATADRGA